MNSRTKFLGSAALLGLVAGPAGLAAQETTTYHYDALGRLIDSTKSGGPNTGRKTGTCFDRAGNRTRYDIATTTPGPCPTPSPAPTPTP